MNKKDPRQKRIQAARDETRKPKNPAVIRPDQHFHCRRLWLSAELPWLICLAAAARTPRRSVGAIVRGGSGWWVVSGGWEEEDGVVNVCGSFTSLRSLGDLAAAAPIRFPALPLSLVPPNLPNLRALRSRRQSLPKSPALPVSPIPPIPRFPWSPRFPRPCRCGPSTGNWQRVMLPSIYKIAHSPYKPIRAFLSSCFESAPWATLIGAGVACSVASPAADDRIFPLERSLGHSPVNTQGSLVPVLILR